MGGDEGNDFDTPRAKGDNKGPHEINHIKNDERKKDFGAHWEMKDDSPGGRNVPDSKLTQNQQKVLKTMDANWGNYEPSPQQGKIRISGNGMVSARNSVCFGRRILTMHVGWPQHYESIQPFRGGSQ